MFETAVEDREMEIQLMKEHIFIKYEEHIPVYDEKVSSSENFQRQRLRWMTGQVQSLLMMLPYLPTAIKTGNIHYIDKTMQQALIPRSILLVLTHCHIDDHHFLPLERQMVGTLPHDFSLYLHCHS